MYLEIFSSQKNTHNDQTEQISKLKCQLPPRWKNPPTPSTAQVAQYCSPNSSANVRHDTFNKNIGVNYAESMTHHTRPIRISDTFAGRMRTFLETFKSGIKLEIIYFYT